MRVDFSNRGIKKLDAKLLDDYLAEVRANTPEIEQALATEHVDEDFAANFDIRELVLILLLDNNGIIKLENLEKFVELKRLSLANNRLVEIKHITKLANLEYVNLVNNSLTSVDSFKDLKRLIWLNVSGNQIKSLDSLRHNIELRYLDASDNSISSLSDLSELKDLTTLKLSGNEIKTLKMAPKYLPTSIKELNLAQNEISDLNEVSYLVGLTELENLTIEHNPCVAYLNINTDNSFDYRPFVINWCLGLATLDGYSITQKEYLKAEWLYSQGKGRHYRPGESEELVEYLTKQCPYTHESFKEEARLSKVLEKQKEYVKSPRQVAAAAASVVDDHHNNHNTESQQSTSPVTHQSKEGSVSSSPIRHHHKHPNSHHHHLPAAHTHSETESISGGDFSYNKTNLMNVNFSSTDSVNTHENRSLYRTNTSRASPKLETQSFAPTVLTTTTTDPENTDSDNNNRRNNNQNMLLSSPEHSPSHHEYKDYDNRPIKPLDQNLLYKQLSEYSEMSSEEYEQMKNRAIRFRSKTAESTVATSQTIPSNRTTTTTATTRPYLLANKGSSAASNNNNSKPVSSNKNLSELNPVASQHQIDNQQHQNRLNRIKKRSKTQDNLISIKKNLESPAAAAASSKAITPSSTATKRTVSTRSTASPSAATNKTTFTNNFATPKIYNKNVLTSKRIVAKKTSVKNSNSPKVLSTPITNTSSKKHSDEEMQQQQQIERHAANLLMKRSISLRSSTENHDSGLADVIAKHYQKQKEVAEFLSNNTSGSDKQQQLITKSPLKDYVEPEFQNKIKQQREEHRLQRETKLKEIKSEFIKKYATVESLDYTTMSTMIHPVSSKPLTFEDRCAIKIQAAWRGYWLRKTTKTTRPFVKSSQSAQLIKYKKIQSQVRSMKQTLDEIKQDHLIFAKISKSSYAELVSQLSSFMSSHLLQGAGTGNNTNSKSIDMMSQIRSKIAPVSFDEQSSDEFKQKYTQLEEKYKQLQMKLDLSVKTQTELQHKYLNVLHQLDNVKLKQPQHQQQQQQPPLVLDNKPEPLILESKQQPPPPPSNEPKLEMYPPLRVRLQKLNEKSVALKWNHNPKNFLIALTGYNIYINDELCAELKPEDQIASINGLQEEGEYRIYVKSVCGKQESEECSNVVVTRVKRKQKKADESATSDTTTNKLRTSFNSELDASAREKDESMEKALHNRLRSSFSTTQSELKDTVTIEEQDSSVLKQTTDNSMMMDSLTTSTRKSERGGASPFTSLPTPSQHELSTTASKHQQQNSSHSFIENYEKLKSQLKRSSSSFSSKTSFQNAPMTLPFTNLSNSNNNQIGSSTTSNSNNNKLGSHHQSGSFSLLDQLPPAPNMSPLKKKALEEALKKANTNSNKSGHTRQPSNESVHSSSSPSSMTLAELMNSAKYSTTEPPSSMMLRSTTSDRNSFLRQSLSLNESDEFIN